MSLEEADRIKAITKGSTVLDSLSWITYSICSFINPGDPSTMLMVSLNRMFEHAKFINAGYSIEMQYMYYLQGYDVGLKLSLIRDLQVESVKYFKNSLIGGTFSFYLLSSSFFINFFPCALKLLVIGIMLLIMFFLLKCFSKNVPEGQSKLKRFNTLIKWNVFLIILYGVHEEITLYAAIELRTANFANFFSVISFFVCAVTVVIAITFFGKLVQITLVFRKVYKNRMTSQNYAHELQETIAKWHCYKPYFGLYKQNFMHQSHMIIFYVRVFLFSLILGTLFEYPVAQAVLAMLMSLIMIVYLIAARPFVSKINTIGQIVMEVILFSYYICVLSLAVAISNGNYDPDSSERTGTIMMVFSIFAQIITFLFALFKAVMLGIQLYKQGKIRLDIEIDLELEMKNNNLDNTFGSNKTFLNDLSSASNIGGARGNKDVINILDQSRVQTNPSDQELNGGGTPGVDHGQNPQFPRLTPEEIAIIENRKRNLIEQARGLYTRQAKIKRRPFQIKKPKVNTQIDYAVGFANNMMMDNGNYNDQMMMNNNGNYNLNLNMNGGNSFGQMNDGNIYGHMNGNSHGYMNENIQRNMNKNFSGNMNRNINESIHTQMNGNMNDNFNVPLKGNISDHMNRNISANNTNINMNGMNGNIQNQIGFSIDDHMTNLNRNTSDHMNGNMKNQGNIVARGRNKGISMPPRRNDPAKEILDGVFS